MNISHFRTSSDTSRFSLFGTLERDPAVKESFSISLISNTNDIEVPTFGCSFKNQFSGKM